jgi:transcriptional regulator with XRE-family HTH domain
MPETFTERFNRLTADLKDAEIASLLGVTEGAVRKLRRGETQTLKLSLGTLRLAKRLGVSHLYLASLTDDVGSPTPPVRGLHESPGELDDDALAEMRATREALDEFWNALPELQLPPDVLQALQARRRVRRDANTG